LNLFTDLYEFCERKILEKFAENLEKFRSNHTWLFANDGKIHYLEKMYYAYLYITLFGALKYSIVCRLHQSVTFLVVVQYSATEMYKNDGSVKNTD